MKARLKDFQGALADAHNIVEVRRKRVDFYARKDLIDVEVGEDLAAGLASDLQERGVLKLEMGDLQGAMADLDEGLDIVGDDYEILKHRGYAAFLMKDEEKARFYAERAVRIQQPGFDWPFKPKTCLGTDPVEYLDYKL